MTTRKRKLLWILAVLLLFAGLSAIWWYPRWLRGPELFSDLPQAQTPATFPQQNLAKRFRWVKLEDSALKHMEKPGNRVHLSLFPDDQHISVTDYARTHWNETHSSVGRINDDMDTMFVLSRADGVRMGSVTLNDGRQFLISHVTDGKYVILEVDPSKNGPCGSCAESHKSTEPGRQAEGSTPIKTTSQSEPAVLSPVAKTVCQHPLDSLAQAKVDMVEKIDFAQGKQKTVSRFGSSPMMATLGLPATPQLAASYGLWGRGGNRRQTMGPSSPGLLHFQRSGNTEYIDIFFFYTGTLAGVANATNVPAATLTTIRANITLMLDIQNDIFLQCGMPFVVRQAGNATLARARMFGGSDIKLTDMSPINFNHNAQSYPDTPFTVLTIGGLPADKAPTWRQVTAPAYVNKTGVDPNTHTVWQTNGLGQAFAAIGVYEPVFTNVLSTDNIGYLSWLGSNNNSAVFGDQFWGTGNFLDLNGDLRPHPFFNFAEGTVQWRLQPGNAWIDINNVLQPPNPYYPRANAIAAFAVSNLTIGVGPIDHPDANHAIRCQPAATGLTPPVGVGTPGAFNWPNNYPATYMSTVFGSFTTNTVVGGTPMAGVVLTQDRLYRYDLGFDDVRANVYLPGVTLGDPILDPNADGLVNFDGLAAPAFTNALNALGYQLGAGNLYGNIFDPMFGLTNGGLGIPGQLSAVGSVPVRMQNTGPGAGAWAAMPAATHVLGFGSAIVAGAVTQRYPNFHRFQEKPFDANNLAPSREPRADILCILTEYGGGLAQFFSGRGGGTANLVQGTTQPNDMPNTLLAAGQNSESTYRLSLGMNGGAAGYVFAHELGHVLGASHGVGDENASVPPGPPLRYDDLSILFSPWRGTVDEYLATGNHFVAWGAGTGLGGTFGRYCTIMAYSTAATNAFTPYTRIPRYSSKSVFWRGIPTGAMPNWKNPYSSFSQLYCDNARGISTIAYIAGQYRDDRGSGRIHANEPVPTRFPGGAPTTTITISADVAPNKTGTAGDNTTTTQTKAGTQLGKNAGTGIGGTSAGGGLGVPPNTGGGLGGISKGGGLPGTTPKPVVPANNTALPNDNSENAMLYPNGTASLDAHNLGATPQDWEQTWDFRGVKFDGGKTVWFYYKPYDANGKIADARIDNALKTALNGELVISTLGSNFDTKLAVLGGFNIREALTLGSNDNQQNGPHPHSEVRIAYDYELDNNNKPKNRLKDFYLIGIDGVNGATGKIKLAIRPSP